MELSGETINLLHIAAVAPLLYYNEYIDPDVLKGVAMFTAGYHLYLWWNKSNRGPMAVGRPLGRYAPF